MNSKISEMMCKRDQLHRKALKSNSTQLWNTYRKLRNTVNSLVRSAKSKYYCDMIEEAKGNSKKVWKVIKEVTTHQCNTASQAVQCIISDDIQHTTSKSIAAALNSYFSSSGKLLADKISNN